MNFTIKEEPITKVLEIGKTLIGNEIRIGEHLFFFSPRTNGVHVFMLGINQNTCSFITVLSFLTDKQTSESYLVSLKNSVLPNFIKKYKDICL